MARRTARPCPPFAGLDPRAVAAAPGRRLGRADFEGPTLQVAKALLGCFLVRRRGGRTLAAMITETEAYVGPRDRACHAHGGRRTPRVEPLYRQGGTIYVYFVYGMHWLLNFSTAGAEKPEAVLIRAVALAEADGWQAVIGPARVTRLLDVDKRFDGDDAARSRELWVEDRGVLVPQRRIRRGPRVGIDFAGEYWAARPWRFWFDVGAGGAARQSPMRSSNSAPPRSANSRAPSPPPCRRQRHSQSPAGSRSTSDAAAGSARTSASGRRR